MRKNQKRVDFSKRFDKQLRKAPPKVQETFLTRFNYFTDNPFHSVLNNHVLKGNYKGCRSINITGDWRAVYREEKDVVIFLVLGTHSELYG